MSVDPIAPGTMVWARTPTPGEGAGWVSVPPRDDGSAGASPTTVAAVPITPAEWKALYATPKVLVAGVAGQVIQPLKLFVAYQVQTAFVPASAHLHGDIGTQQLAWATAALAVGRVWICGFPQTGAWSFAASDVGKPFTIGLDADISASAGALAGNATAYVEYVTG